MPKPTTHLIGITMQNCNNTTLIPIIPDRPTVVYMISVMADCLLVPYIYTLYIFYTNINEFGNYAYHICLMTVGIFDILTLLKIGVMDVFVNRDKASPEIVIVSWMLLMFFYFGQLWATTIMSINRACSVLFWKSYNEIFNMRLTLASNGLAVLAAAAFAIPYGIPNVGTIWTETCQGMKATGTKEYMLLYISMMTVLINGNVVLYAVLYFFMRKNQKNVPDEAGKKERKILQQSFCIVFFHFMIYMTNALVFLGVPSKIMETPLIAFNVLNAGVNPFLYLKFSSNFRKEIAKRFKFFSTSTSVVPIVSTQPMSNANLTAHS